MTTHPATDPSTPAVPRPVDPARVSQALDAAAESRQHELTLLPPPEDDPVAAAQRIGIQQTLAEIAAARRRLDEGTYGACTRCDQPIPAARLDFRPWSTTCIRCAGR